MGEIEWLAGDDPLPMLEFLGPKASQRDLRLFAAGCCRSAWNLITDAHREAIAVAERHADGQATDAELGAAVSAVHQNRRKANQIDRLVYDAVRCPKGVGFHTYSAVSVADGVARVLASAAAPDPSPSLYVYWVGDRRVEERPPPNSDRIVWDATHADSRRDNVSLVRCVFGNPFRPVAVEPGWRTSAVVDLASGIYADRAWDRLPVLADALEDAGCAHPDVLGHLRGPGPHARGCWVVDLLLGKS